MLRRKLGPLLLGFILVNAECGIFGGYGNAPDPKTPISNTTQEEWEGGVRFAGPGGSGYMDFAAEPPEEKANLLREHWGKITGGILAIGAGAGLVIGGGAAAKTTVEAKAATVVGGAVVEAVIEGGGSEAIAPGAEAPLQLRPVPQPPPYTGPAPSSITPYPFAGELADPANGNADISGDQPLYLERAQLRALGVPAQYIDDFLELQDAVRNWHLRYMQDTRMSPEIFLQNAQTSARRLAFKLRNARSCQFVCRGLADQLDHLINWAQGEIDMFHHPQRPSRRDPE